MLNITIHQGNVNEKHMSYVLTLIRMLRNGCAEDVEKWTAGSPLAEMYNDVGCLKNSLGMASDLPDISECS